MDVEICMTVSSKNQPYCHTMGLNPFWSQIRICIQFILMPCPFTSPKMFCAGPNCLSQPKKLTAFSASSKTFVPAQKSILLNANHLFVWHKMFVTATICKQIFGPAQKIWTSPKHFGTCKRTRHQCLFKSFVPAQKPILLNANHLFVWHKMFVTATICK